MVEAAGARHKKIHTKAESAEAAASCGERERRIALPKEESRSQRSADLYLKHLQFSFHGSRSNFIQMFASIGVSFAQCCTEPR